MSQYQITKTRVLLDGKPLELRKLANEAEAIQKPFERAFTILAHCVDEQTAQQYRKAFETVISSNEGRKITGENVKRWVDYRCRLDTNSSQIGSAEGLRLVLDSSWFTD